SVGREAAAGGCGVAAHRAPHQAHRAGGTDAAPDAGASVARYSRVTGDGAVDHLERAERADPAAEACGLCGIEVAQPSHVVADDAALDAQGTLAENSAPAGARRRKSSAYLVSLNYAVSNNERTAVADCPALIDAEDASQGDPRHTHGYASPGRIDIEHAVILRGMEDVRGGTYQRPGRARTDQLEVVRDVEVTRQPAVLVGLARQLIELPGWGRRHDHDVGPAARRTRVDGRVAIRGEDRLAQRTVAIGREAVGRGVHSDRRCPTDGCHGQYQGHTRPQ